MMEPMQDPPKLEMVNLSDVEPNFKHGERIVAVIPARAGSKRLRNKNMAIIHGYPMFAWAVYAAMQSTYVDHIIVTTDDPQILHVTKQLHQLDNRVWGYERPPELATDDAKMEDAAAHAVELLEQNELQKMDLVAILQANVPYRQSRILDRCIEHLLIVGDVDSVVTVIPMRDHPWVQKELIAVEEGEGHDLVEIPLCRCGAMRVKHWEVMYQKYPPRWKLDGAVLLTKRDCLMNRRPDMHGYLGDRVAAVKQEWWEAYEVEDQWDLVVADRLVYYNTPTAPFLPKIQEED